MSPGSATALATCPAARPETESPRFRPPLAVIVSRFPVVTETFILREIDELERQGQQVLLVPLIRERPETIHPEAVPWVARARYTPFLSASIARSNWIALRADPLSYLRLLGRLIRGSWRSPGFCTRSLALFPKAVHLGKDLLDLGVRHVHAHFATHPATVAWVIETLFGIRFSFTIHAHDLFVDRSLLGDKIRAASFVRTISRFNRDVVRQLYPDAGSAQLVVGHMGIDPDLYLPSPADSRVDDAHHVLCVAALKPYKGVSVLIDAMARLADRGVAVSCDIVGDGPDRDALQRRIEAAGLDGKVSLCGPATQQDVIARLHAADLVVLPSVVDRHGQMEGIPVALMEAMAAGKPVVASRLSGIPELVEDGVTGRLVPAGDAHALARAVEGLIVDRSLARRLGKTGQHRVRGHFNLSDTTEVLLRHVDRAIEPDGSLAKRVQESSFPDLPAGAISARWCTAGPDADVHGLVLGGPGKGRDVVLKVHHDRADCEAPASVRARREFVALRELRLRLGSAVPEPLHRDERQALVWMEFVPAPTLEATIRSRRPRSLLTPDAQLIRALAATGVWLRRFQEVAASPESSRSGSDGNELLRSLLRRIERDAARCRSSGALPGVAPDPFAVAKSLAAERSGDAQAVVPRHGDFWPGNLLWSPSRIAVIDFEGIGEGLPFEDAGAFLLHLRRYFAWPGGTRCYRPLRRAFLDGWRPGRDHRGVRLGMLAAAVSLLARSDAGTVTRRQRTVLLRAATGGER